MVGHGGSSADSYLADPTSSIPSHCTPIVVTSTFNQLILSLLVFSLVDVTPKVDRQFVFWLLFHCSNRILICNMNSSSIHILWLSDCAVS